MVLVGRIQRYIFRESLSGLLMVLGVIVLAIVLVDVVEQMRTIGARTDISLPQAFGLTMLKTPSLILETLPFAMLVGSILTFSRLNRRSEIPAIRAAGVSAWRFLGPIMALAIAVGVLMVTVLDPLATRLNAQFQLQRQEILGGGSDVSGGSIWLSQGDLTAKDPAGAPSDTDFPAIISAQHVVGRGQALQDVTFYFFAPGKPGTDEREFTHRIDAKRAVLAPGFWQLEGVTENDFRGETKVEDKLALPTTLKADTLLSRFASSRTIPFWELPEFIRDTRSAGLEVDQYVLRLHTQLATPFFMLAMALIGAVVCLRLARSGGVSQLIGAGAVTGFVLYFVTRIAAGLSASGAAAPEVAAWSPPLFALFAVLTLIAHVEDG